MRKLPIENMEIQNLEMQAFLKNWEVWLNKRYRLSTIRGSMGTASYYIKWCEAENIHPFKTTYPELLSFVQAEKAAGKTKRTIKQKLVAIKHFYNYLIETKQREENPASELLIRNETRKLPPTILKYEVLEKLYQDFPARGIVGKRNKAILGLLIYQGINTGELQVLKVKDVKTAEGKIYIPGVNRSNDRTLKLEAHQIVQLQNYIIQIRPVIMAMNEHSGDKLFFSSGSSNQLGNSFTRMLKIMRSVFPDIKNLQQIRASMIAHWYTLHNTRQVQYMAGHRYVSSTERYRGDKLEGLQEQLEKLHPIQ